MKVPLHGKHGKGKFAIIDDEDYPLISKWKWYVDGGYARRGEFCHGKFRSIKLHNVIMGHKPSQRSIIDHINRNPLDNRKCNLRVATPAQNISNMKPQSNTSGLRGVCWDKSREKWLAQIGYNGMQIMLGRFDNKEEAACVRDAAAHQLHGEFAALNFPDSIK